MSGLPTFPGLDVLSEVGRVGPTVRYRLASTREFLVLFDEEVEPSSVTAAAEAWVGVDVDGLCTVRSLVRHDGRIGVVIEGELGEDPWQQPAWGESESLTVLRRAASVVAALHARGLSHGALKPHGLRLLSEGEVEVLPPVVLPAPAAPTGLSPIARDLSALADLACHLIARAPLERPAGIGALPAAVTENASPATTQAIRLVLETAADEPAESDAVEVLKRVGWAREIERPSPVAGARRTASAVSPEAAEVASAPRERRERPPRPEPRSSAVPIAVAVALLVMGGALVVIGNPDAMKKFFRGDAGNEVAALPTPKGTLEAERKRPVVTNLYPTPPSGVSDPAPSASGGGGSTELADQILQELAEKRRARDASRSSKRSKKSYDRTLIDEGEGLQKEAKAILVEVRDGGLTPAKKNVKLDEAIKKLEAAREKYEGFAEQFPSRQRLVEGSIEDVNSLLFFAYRQKTAG